MVLELFFIESGLRDSAGQELNLALLICGKLTFFGGSLISRYSESRKNESQ